MTRPIEKLLPKDLGERAGKVIQDFRKYTGSNLHLFYFGFRVLQTALASIEAERLLGTAGPYKKGRFVHLKRLYSAEICEIIETIEKINEALIAEQSIDDVAGRAGIKLVLEKSAWENYQQKLKDKGYVAPPEKQSESPSISGAN